MKVDYRLAIVGALAFGFSTYLIIIFGAGHNAKAHAMGYLPMLLGGIVLVFRKKYLWGFVLTAIAMALEIQANHYQMTYYFMLLVLIVGAVYFFDAVRNKYVKRFFTAILILHVAVTLGIAANAARLLAAKSRLRHGRVLGRCHAKFGRTGDDHLHQQFSRHLALPLAQSGSKSPLAKF